MKEKYCAMNIDDYFRGREQDDAIELNQKILAFRDLMFEGCRKNAVASKAATVAAFAIWGAYYKYDACCILYFCELAFWDWDVPQEAKTDSGHVLCPKCQQEAKSP